MQIASEIYLDLQDKTWPAAEIGTVGPWLLRASPGGGQRVNAATPLAAQSEDLINALDGVEAWYRQRGLEPLFQILEDHPPPAVLEALAQRGFEAGMACAVLEVPVAGLCTEPFAQDTRPYLIAVSCPLAELDELWRAGGIDSGRRAVMTRAAALGLGSQIFAGRLDQRLAGACFTARGDAASAGYACAHALLVTPWARRRHLGRDLVYQCARWAAQNGAETLAVSVELGNTGALALYQGLGFRPFCRYRYLRRP
ncbi:MAG: GNAT family N-acetyltransferase [Neomegalonema sp.]|nr:GNAT family N-acetyltransferase [Neomegalonema sp.]